MSKLRCSCSTESSAIVHQDVDAAIGRDNLGDCGLDLAGVADVADHAERGATCSLDVGHDLVDVPRCQRENDHLRTFRREQLRGGAADAATGTSDWG